MVIDKMLTSERLDLIKKYIECLKGVDTDTIASINCVRELQGMEVLNDYEKLFDVNPIAIRLNVKNYIVSRIRDILDSLKKSAAIDKTVITDYISTSLTIEKFDVAHIDTAAEYLSDVNISELVSHKLTLDDKKAVFLDSINVIKNIDVDPTDDMFNVIVENHNALLKTLDEYEVGDMIINIDGLTPYSPDVTAGTSSDIRDVSALREKILSLDSYLSSKVLDVKNGVKDMDFNIKSFDKLDAKLSNALFNFNKGLGSEDALIFQTNGVITAMNTYFSMLSLYLESISNYVTKLEVYITAFNNVNDASKMISSLVSKKI